MWSAVWCESHAISQSTVMWTGTKHTFQIPVVQLAVYRAGSSVCTGLKGNQSDKMTARRGAKNYTAWQQGGELKDAHSLLPHPYKAECVSICPLPIRHCGDVLNLYPFRYKCFKGGQSDREPDGVCFFLAPLCKVTHTAWRGEGESKEMRGQTTQRGWGF